MNPDWVNALLGGVLIGVAVSLMLFWNGKVTGISGILGGLFSPSRDDVAWRFLFVLGLFLGGLFIKAISPDSIGKAITPNAWVLVLAGVLVGVGTTMGSGCTSGHGVCGISRLSKRSIVATMVFMIAGVAAVYVFKSLGVWL